MIQYVVFLAVLLSGFAAFSQDGSLDNTFDGDGKVLTAVGTFDDGAKAVKIQSDGKIVVAGASYSNAAYDFMVARYNSDGSPDLNFGTGGVTVTQLRIYDDIIRSMVIQSDGKIVVCGTSFDGLNADMALARYKTNGSIDSTFGVNGIVLNATPGIDEYVFGMDLQNDGKLVVTGRYFSSSDFQVLVARFDSNGTPDATFDGDGMVLTDVSATYDDVGTDVVVQPDGKIVVVGAVATSSETDLAILRYNSNGSPDNTFSSDGLYTHGIGGMYDEYANAVTLQSDGKIVLVGGTGSSFQDVVIARYTTNGTLDTEFDTDGIVLTDLGSASDIGDALDVKVTSDGKIITAGYVRSGTRLIFSVARYLTNGTLDNAFDSDGLVTTDFGGAYDCQGVALAVQTDGKIVVAGSSFDTQNEIAIARYNNTVVSGVGVNELAVEALTVVPNPFSIYTELFPSTELVNATVRIVRPEGAVVRELQYVNGTVVRIERESLPAGLYFVEVQSSSYSGLSKVLVH